MSTLAGTCYKLGYILWKSEYIGLAKTFDLIHAEYVYPHSDQYEQVEDNKQGDKRYISQRIVYDLGFKNKGFERCKISKSFFSVK